MTFYSMLFEREEDRAQSQAPQEPAFFADLNLDQVIHAITAGRGEYDLKPLFYASLHDIAAIEYRHEIMRDLEYPLLSVHQGVRAKHARNARTSRSGGKAALRSQQGAWFLSAVEIYCAAVGRLGAELAAAACESRGFVRFRDYVAAYATSGGFTVLTAETQRLQADLAAVRYCLLIDGNCVQVRKYAAEVDYSAEVEATFAKFKQGAARDYRTKFPSWPEMNQLEARILISSPNCTPTCLHAWTRTARATGTIGTKQYWRLIARFNSTSRTWSTSRDCSGPA